MHARVTQRNKELAHQISLRFVSGQQWITAVHCNCTKGPIGKIDNKGNPWPIFNDPANHDNIVVPFVVGQSTAQVFDVH